MKGKHFWRGICLSASPRRKEEIAIKKTPGGMGTAQDLREAIMEGAVQRVRPKMMTVAAIMGELLPIMWTTGTGADVMKRIAAPMIGGMVSSTVLTLLVIPILYALWRSRSIPAVDRQLDMSSHHIAQSELP